MIFLIELIQVLLLMNWTFWKSDDSTKSQDVTIPLGNPKKGKQIFFNQCAGCHDLDGDAQNLEAPPLRYVMGNRVASTAFDYSRAMKKAKFTWTPQDMNQFLFAPKRKIPGTSMNFGGIRNARDRADLVAYLMYVSER